MERMFDGIWRWTWFSEEKGMNFNGYAVKLPEGVTLIDPAYADEDCWKEIEKLGRLSSILLTNKDHERASDELRRRFRIPVLVHEAEKPFLNAEPDRTFGDGETLCGELKAVRFQRLKSPGECAFYWKERKLLFVGDAVTGHPKGSFGLVMKHKGRPEIFDDLKRLLELDFDAVLMGDGEPILSGAKALLRDFLKVTV